MSLIGKFDFKRDKSNGDGTPYVMEIEQDFRYESESNTNVNHAFYSLLLKMEAELLHLT